MGFINFFDGQAEEYYSDLVLSIGPNCRPARNLSINHLREFSSPLDWMMNYSLDTVLHLFRDRFDDFFAEYEADSDNPEGSEGMLRVTDTKNQIVSIHHFPDNMRPDSYYPQFIEKMNARIQRLESRIQDVSGIVLISNRADSRDDMLNFLRAFSVIYPHLRIRLVNIRHDEKMPYNSFRQEMISDEGSMSYVEYILNDTDHGVQNPSGNLFLWSGILADYRTPYSDAVRNEWLRLRKGSRQLVIYGAGCRCVYLLIWLSAVGITVDGIAVCSMVGNPEEINRVKVRLFPSYSKNASIIVSSDDMAEAIAIVIYDYWKTIEDESR